MRKKHNAESKAFIAIEALRERKTASEIASDEGVHPVQVAKWKKELIERASELFEDKRKNKKSDGPDNEDLYQQIGRLNMELEWLKKNIKELGVDLRDMIDKDFKNISIRRQCELVGLNRSNLYYRSVEEDSFHLSLLREVDEIYTRYPFFGSRKIQKFLNEEKGYTVNRKRIQRIMQDLGLKGIVPKRNCSKINQQNKKYPYLLSNVIIDRPNIVWSSDITYIRMDNGFLYLVAIIDWFSRAVSAWNLLNSMDVHLCTTALKSALEKFGPPEIFNSDQGSQFTSLDHTKILLDYGIKISMDGRGRAFDNIFIERLWRTVKYEEVYLKSYSCGNDAYKNLSHYFDFYNNKRPHQALSYKTPIEVYREGLVTDTVRGVYHPSRLTAHSP